MYFYFLPLKPEWTFPDPHLPRLAPNHATIPRMVDDAKLRLATDREPLPMRERGIPLSALCFLKQQVADWQARL